MFLILSCAALRFLSVSSPASAGRRANTRTPSPPRALTRERHEICVRSPQPQPISDNSLLSVAGRQKCAPFPSLLAAPLFGCPSFCSSSPPISRKERDCAHATMLGGSAEEEEEAVNRSPIAFSSAAAAAAAAAEQNAGQGRADAISI